MSESGHTAPTLREVQQIVDDWIKSVGVRYFSELTNTAVLMEEVGEVARIMARRYGDQSFKESDTEIELADEFADVLFVLICLANQTGIDLSAAFASRLAAKTERDRERHANNPKLQATEAISNHTRSDALFEQIDARIGENPEWVKQVKAIYQFRVTGEDGGQYVVDLRNGEGGARPGVDEDAGCRMTVAFKDFTSMLEGDLSPQMAFLSGKLKIEGNVMLAARLAPLFASQTS